MYVGQRICGASAAINTHSYEWGNGSVVLQYSSTAIDIGIIYRTYISLALKQLG